MTEQSPKTTLATQPESQNMETANMRYFKAPDIIATGVTEAELTAQVDKHRATYFTRREKLEAVTSELAKLRKTLGALNQQEKAADGAWREDFVKGFGKQSKAVRDQLKQKAQWASEAEQTKEMIALLVPQAEWLQMQTYAARLSLQIRVRQLAELSSHNQLVNGLGEISKSEGMTNLSAVMPHFFERVEVSTYNDPLFMIGLGIDVALQPGKNIAPYLNKEDDRQVNHEIRLRKYAALGELLVSFMPKVDKQTMPNTQLPPRLACEAAQGEYASNLGFARRLKELELQMEYVPSLDDLDNGTA